MLLVFLFQFYKLFRRLGAGAKEPYSFVLRRHEEEGKWKELC